MFRRPKPSRMRACQIELPGIIERSQQRLEQVPAALMRPGERDRADMINPCLEVGLLRFGRGLAGPWHNDLRGTGEGEQRFAAPDTNSLEIADLLRMIERVRCFAGMPEARSKRFDGKVGDLGLLGARDTQAQPDMEGHGQIRVRKLNLRIEVRRIGDDPPAIDIRVNVPHRVLMTEDVLDIDLLQELNREVG